MKSLFPFPFLFVYVKTYFVQQQTPESNMRLNQSFYFIFWIYKNLNSSFSTRLKPRTTDAQWGNRLHCTAKNNSHYQIFKKGRSIFCMPHQPKFSLGVRSPWLTHLILEVSLQSLLLWPRVRHALQLMSCSSSKPSWLDCSCTTIRDQQKLLPRAKTFRFDRKTCISRPKPLANSTLEWEKPKCS